jgi:hypothetical protein
MSLTTRTILAILLMAGFYVLSLAVVASLLFIPYAEWTYLNRIHPKVAEGLKQAHVGALAWGPVCTNRGDACIIRRVLAAPCNGGSGGSCRRSLCSA